MARNGSKNGTQLSYIDPDDPKVKEALQTIFSLIHTHSHVDLSNYKLTTVGRRIQRQMKLHKIKDVDDFAVYLTSKPKSVRALCEDIFVHVTEFFRDAESFRALTKTVLPSIIKKKHSSAPIRIWVPGCSTGEEPYSIAISLVEQFEKQKSEIPFQIFATDISESAVQVARSGIYGESEVEGVSPERLEKYFDKVKDGYKVKREIRDLCVFSKHDLTRNPPFAKIDLISCRNVLIYFNPDLQKRVLPVFHYALNSDGYLWLGRSEAPSGISKLFTVVDKTNKIYSRVNTDAASRTRFPYNQVLAGKIDLKITDRILPSIDHQKEFDRIILSKYAPAGAIVNAELEIIYVRGHTAPYLELPAGHPNYNFLKMLRPDLMPAARLALQEAVKKNAFVRKEGLTYSFGRERRKVNIEVVPVNPHSSPKERQFLVVFEDPSAVNGVEKTTDDKNKPRKKVRKSHQGSKDNYVSGLLRELDSLREYHQSLAEGYEASQEELTASNEELQSTLEEFQSTNEELETAKEELQASNEELTTVNEELQLRNDELAQSEERFRLLVGGVKDYAIYMLSPEGYITTWNEGARRIKGYEAQEAIGRHVSLFYSKEDLDSGKPAAELTEAAQSGSYKDEGWRIRKDGSRFWANIVLTRINDSKGDVIGFSKITRDMSELKRIEGELVRSEIRARLLIHAVKDYAIFMLDPHGNITSWNEGAERLKGYKKDEIVGQHFSKFYLQDEIARKHPEEELEIARATGRYEEEGWRVRKDGSLFWANVVISRVNDEGGQLIGFAKVTRDLTERRRVEELLRKSNEELEDRVKHRTAELLANEEQLRKALTSRDEFLSIASHELKTPLTSLKLQLQINEKSLLSDRIAPLSKEELLESFALALRQVNSLTDLVEDLLDVSRVQSGKFNLAFEQFNFSDLVEEVARRLAAQLKGAGCTLQLKLGEGLVGRWDRNRVEQIVVNLVSNAIKYASKNPIHISVDRRDQIVRLMVKDFGPGIEKEKQSKIFERFERATSIQNVSGMGLGLYIVKTITEAHGGTVQVDSEVGQGSTFIVDLPLEPNNRVVGTDGRSVET